MKSYVIFCCISFILMITGCAVSDKNNTYWGSYLPTATSPGLMVVEFNSSLDYAKKYMVNNCSGYGGLDNSSIVETTGKLGWGNTYWSYRCNGLSQKPPPLSSFQQAPTQSRTDSPSANKSDLGSQINEAKTKCAELGFKANTEAFGKCVLKLTN